MDDQRTDRESVGSAIGHRLNYAARGFLSTVMFSSCALSVFFSLMGVWEFYSPTPALKGHAPGWVPPTLTQLVLEGLYYGAIGGAIAGAAGGIGIALLRLLKNNFPTT